MTPEGPDGLQPWEEAGDGFEPVDDGFEPDLGEEQPVMDGLERDVADLADVSAVDDPTDDDHPVAPEEVETSDAATAFDGLCSSAFAAAVAEVLGLDPAALEAVTTGASGPPTDLVGGLSARQLATAFDSLGVDAVVSHGDLDELVARHDVGGEVLVEGPNGSRRLLSIDGYNAVFEDVHGAVQLPVDDLLEQWETVAREQLHLHTTHGDHPDLQDVTVLPMTLNI